AVLLQPLVTETRKNKVLDEAFGSRISPTSLNFLRLLIRKRREDLIDEVMRDFRALVAAQQNRVDAIATTANPLSPGQEERLTQSLQSMTGKTVSLTTNVDPAIVGGVVVRIGDSVIDGSVRGQLLRLEQQLLGHF
ncbi:MAG: ATP synthase F1 subunit delta, partial [Armatimonadota bacterium]|nr:ATP synthase F1 subunit delta [Armatimonadota bacterium]